MPSDAAGQTGLIGALRRRLPVVHYVVDCLVWLVALPLTTFSRYDFSVGELAWDATLRSWLVAVLGQGVRLGIAIVMMRRYGDKLAKCFNA